MKPMIPVLAALLILGVGCSDDEASPVCDARDDVASSVEELRNIDVVDDGLDALRADLDAVADGLARFRAEAGNELEPQIDAVRDAVDQIRSAVDAGGSATEVAAAIGTGLSDYMGMLRLIGDNQELQKTRLGN